MEDLRLNRRLLVLAAALALATVSCACGLVYCSDSATITVRRAGGQSLMLAASLDLDGAKVECPVPVLDPAARYSTIQRCNENVDVTVYNSGSMVIDVREAAPRRIGVVLRDGNTVLAERTFAPRYATWKPNGDFCEPTCRRWEDTWTLP